MSDKDSNERNIDLVITPMRKQYLTIKQRYADCIVLFRLGDFYEAFDEDAKIVSHGCTGKGNDQVRFDTTIQYLNPKLEILAPVT